MREETLERSVSQGILEGVTLPDRALRPDHPVASE